MTAKPGFTLDIGQFSKALNNVTGKQIPNNIEIGLGQAANQWLTDSINTAPVVEATLRGSGSVHVNGKLVGTSPNTGAGTPNTGPVDHGTMPEALVGYNSPYAAYQHEGQRRDGSHKIKKWSQKGTGPKFLERPGIENADEYKRIIADAIGFDAK